MSKDDDKLPPEHEILRGHTVDANEALLRASGGALKGASPVAAHDQTIFQVKELLRNLLPDTEGALRTIILQRLDGNPPLVARHFGAPRDLLRDFLERVLGTDEALSELVRETDAHWGRLYQEKPYFEAPGRPADPEDPYTRAGVRTRLEKLQRLLSP